MTTPPAFHWRFLGPRYWPVWLALMLIALMAVLPWVVQRQLGTWIGWLIWHLAGQRRNDTLVNLRLCFPEYDDATRERMGREVFYQTGQAIFSTATIWFWPLAWQRNHIHFEGMELLQAAKAQGRGVLLLGAHYTTLDPGGTLCSLHQPVVVLYRPQNNALLDYLVYNRRMRAHPRLVDHDNMRGLIRALKDGEIVWYTPDQDYGLRQGVFAPFFGVPAATITAPARLARVNQSAVIFVHFTVARNGHIHMRFLPGPDHFPTGDEVADATCINQHLEGMIRREPTQYMWYHRRFKTRPPGEPVPYQKKRRQIREEREEALRNRQQP